MMNDECRLTSRVLLADGSAVARARAERAGVSDALAQLVADADAALAVPAQSVMMKTTVPPSGDKHDYVSLAKYWWPDPVNPGGPYVRHDGQINPEWENFDRIPLGKMHIAVTALALGSYFTADDHRSALYAQHAAKLLNTWFLDPATRMNPHVRFGQFVPGVIDGRPNGIIDTFPLTKMLDAVELMRRTPSPRMRGEGRGEKDRADARPDERVPQTPHPTLSPSTGRGGHWDDADHAALRDWFAHYLHWLIESDMGREEAASNNNHANWYDVQVVYYLIALGRADEARHVLTTRVADRIAHQVAEDGSQPEELRRTLAFGYSVFNLLGFMQLAFMGERVEVDLWNYRRPGDAASASPLINRAMDWLLPFCSFGVAWPYQQIVKYETGGEQDRLIHILRFAELKYGGGKYEAALRTRADLSPERDRVNLLYPRP